jgi:hypothetical protein
MLALLLVCNNLSPIFPLRPLALPGPARAPRHGSAGTALRQQRADYTLQATLDTATNAP